MAFTVWATSITVTSGSCGIRTNAAPTPWVGAAFTLLRLRACD